MRQLFWKQIKPYKCAAPYLRMQYYIIINNREFYYLMLMNNIKIR